MRYTNSIMVFVRIATIWYFVIVALNLIVPLLDGKSLNVNLFSVLMIVIWTVAILSANGFIKRVASKSDESIVYDTILPIMPATIVRIVEFGWMFFRHHATFKPKVFFIEVVFDVIFIVILLLDKTHYYYEAVVEEEEND